MGRVTGDKGRHRKQTKQKLAKREKMRALVKEWRAKAPAAATPAKSAGH